MVAEAGIDDLAVGFPGSTSRLLRILKSDQGRSKYSQEFDLTNPDPFTSAMYVVKYDFLCCKSKTILMTWSSFSRSLLGRVVY